MSLAWSCLCCSKPNNREKHHSRLYSSLPGIQMSIRKKQGIMTSQPCDPDDIACEIDVTAAETSTAGASAVDTGCDSGGGVNNHRKTKCSHKHSRKYSLPFFMWHKKRMNEEDEIEDDDDITESETKRIERQMTRETTSTAATTTSTHFDLSYNLQVMKQKQCISLINNTLLGEGSGASTDPESLRQCSVLDPETLRQCSALVRAVEIAAYEIYSNRGDCSRRDSSFIKTSLDEYKISELILSSVDRVDTRRSGLAERCEVERDLVRLSVKYLMQHGYMSR